MRDEVFDVSPKAFVISDEDYRISEHLPEISSFNYFGSSADKQSNLRSQLEKEQSRSIKKSKY